MNEVKNDKNLCVDLELLDISKSFDSLWTDEIMNDMYDVMEPNDKLSLMYKIGTRVFFRMTLTSSSHSLLDMRA